MWLINLWNKIFKRKKKLPKRPELDRPPRTEWDIQAAGVIEVKVIVQKAKTFLGRIAVKRGEFRMLLAEYLNTTKEDEVKEQKLRNQSIQCILHEIMHIPLYGTDYTHNEDPDSLLHYYVEGDTLYPNTWDIDVMNLASERIEEIVIKVDKRTWKKYTNIATALLMATQRWNTYINRSKPLITILVY